jgi:hypothetical protein
MAFALRTYCLSDCDQMKINACYLLLSLIVGISLPACGGGGSDAAVIVPNQGASIAPANTNSNILSGTVVNDIASGDRVNGQLLTNRAAISLLAGAIAAEPTARQQADATKYPVAGKQFFRNLVGMSGSDTTLSLLNSTPSTAKTVTIVGEFQSFTAARVFPCTFNPADYQSSRGDCDTVNIAPGPYPAQSSAGSKCRDIAYKSGIIQQCIKD